MFQLVDEAGVFAWHNNSVLPDAQTNHMQLPTMRTGWYIWSLSVHSALREGCTKVLTHVELSDVEPRLLARISIKLAIINSIDRAPARQVAATGGARANAKYSDSGWEQSTHRRKEAVTGDGGRGHDAECGPQPVIKLEVVDVQDGAAVSPFRFHATRLLLGTNGEIYCACRRCDQTDDKALPSGVMPAAVLVFPLPDCKDEHPAGVCEAQALCVVTGGQEVCVYDADVAFFVLVE